MRPLWVLIPPVTLVVVDRCPFLASVALVVRVAATGATETGEGVVHEDPGCGKKGGLGGAVSDLRHYRRSRVTPRYSFWGQ